jgi:hypothetical protein
MTNDTLRYYTSLLSIELMTKVTADVYKQYQDLETRLSDALDQGDEKLVTQILAELDEWAKTNNVDLKVPVEQDGGAPPCSADPGRVKDWGANTDANKWKVVPMQKPTTLWKVVDENGVNVADQFMAQACAQAYIDAHKLPPCPPGQHRDNTGNCVPDTTGGDKDQFGIRKIFPDKQGGQTNTDGSARYFTRHYASGKPDDPTVEYTIDMPKGHQQDLEATAIVQMTGMNHNDTVDWKLRGPPHDDGDGKAWYCFDQETDGGSGGKHFQVERPHPKMHDSSNKVQLTGVSIPNISSARFGWKAIAVNKTPDDVYLACWINLTPDDESGWRKIWDVHDKGQIDSGQITPPTGGHCQIRIDGIKGKPTFEKGSVREIAYDEGATTAS